MLASSLKAELKALPFEPDMIVASYHGMPKDYVAKGDPYESQCVRTTQLLREQLGLDETKLMMTFQSRFGRAAWLEPYTIKTVKALAKKGVKNLVVITPGFSADCLETLEEIAVENARVFKRYGGAELCRHSLPQRQRGRHADDLAARHARAQGLGLIAAIRIRRAGARYAAYLNFTTAVSTCWHRGHSKVRRSNPGSSNVMRARYISAVHFGHCGRAPIGAFSSVYSENVICDPCC